MYIQIHMHIYIYLYLYVPNRNPRIGIRNRMNPTLKQATAGMLRPLRQLTGSFTRTNTLARAPVRDASLMLPHHDLLHG